MVAGRFFYEPAAGVRDALSIGASLPERLTPDTPVALYAAALNGEAWTLGRYQLAEQVLGPTASNSQPPASTRTWLHRASGGVTARAGDGVIYVALALLERSVLMPCPAGRLLNRNVRGVLTGLRHIGLPINYFGRDFLSCGALPVIYVGWDAREHGPILLEFFIAHSEPWFVPETALAYPQRTEPALRGRAPTTVAEARPGLTAEELVRALADGHARAFGVHWSAGEKPQLAEPSAAEPSSAHTPAPPDRLVWSPPREEAIGFVSAGVRLGDDDGSGGGGKFAAVRVVGDFFAHRACTATLEELLLGTVPSRQGVGEAVDGAFTRSGYDVEGIRSLGTLRDAILAAAAAAAQRHTDRRRSDD